MTTTSLWQKITQVSQSYPQLKDNLEVDVAIIGGGITGITTALRLQNQGKKVALLEAHKIGGVTTGASTGNLYVPVQPYFQNIVKKFDDTIARTIAHSRRFAIDFIEEQVKAKNIRCDFSRRPWYLYSNDNKQLDFLKKEVETLKKLGLGIDYTTTLPLPFKFKKAAMLENQARFNPLQYTVSLAEDLKISGCLLYENTPVIKIDENSPCVLHTPQGKVTAKKIVFATHSPLGVRSIQLFTACYRSYVVAAHTKDQYYPEGQFWDLDKPHHATCTHAVNSAQPNLLMVAGSHHRTGQDLHATNHFKELEKFLRNNFNVEDISYQWSAQHFHAADNVPYIGPLNNKTKDIYIATGYFADGLVYGTLAGIIMGDLILGKNPEFATVYNVNRFDPIASIPFLLKENSNTFFQYLKDYPLPKPKNFEDIKKGQGKIVELNREKLAISRDENNQLHAVSAVCTHMKGIVKWNDAEKTWDCPCHGSRFSASGEVLEGPAKTNLARKDVKINGEKT